MQVVTVETPKQIVLELLMYTPTCNHKLRHHQIFEDTKTVIPLHQNARPRALRYGGPSENLL